MTPTPWAAGCTASRPRPQPDAAAACAEMLDALEAADDALVLQVAGEPG